MFFYLGSIMCSMLSVWVFYCCLANVIIQNQNSLSDQYEQAQNATTWTPRRKLGQTIPLSGLSARTRMWRDKSSTSHGIYIYIFYLRCYKGYLDKSTWSIDNYHFKSSQKQVYFVYFLYLIVHILQVLDHCLNVILFYIV